MGDDPMPTCAVATDSRPMEYMFLSVGVLIGVVLGTIVVALASVGSYDRGFQDGTRHFILEP